MFSTGRVTFETGSSILVLADGIRSFGKTGFSGFTAVKSKSETLTTGGTSYLHKELVSHHWYIFPWRMCWLLAHLLHPQIHFLSLAGLPAAPSELPFFLSSGLIQ